MNKDYKNQILDHNVNKFNLMVKNNLDMFSSGKILTQTNQDIALQINFISNAKKIREYLKWYFGKDKH